MKFFKKIFFNLIQKQFSLPAGDLKGHQIWAYVLKCPLRDPAENTGCIPHPYRICQKNMILEISYKKKCRGAGPRQENYSAVTFFAVMNR